MPNERQQAFLALLEPVYDRLSRYALAVTRNEMDGEDLVSATILTAYEQFDPKETYAQFFHYLVTIASRLHKRKKYRERNRMLYNERTAQQIADVNPSPESAAEIRLVMDALATLPEKIRETLVLFEVSDFSLEEIRKIQGGTLSGVKTRLKRGRERLAKTLGVAPPPKSGKERPITTQGSSDYRNTGFLLLAEESYVR